MAPAEPIRLHVGCGPQRLEGWINIDRQDLPGVDLVADVTDGLPVEGAEVLFAEHFLEHLRLDHALAFLREAHRVLAPGGWLRLSTPNLEWVLTTHYDATGDDSRRRLGALATNLAFRGWSHQFLWNRALLGEALLAAGFTDVAWRSWGESGNPQLCGLERHERYPDAPESPHVLVVEARRGQTQPERWRELLANLEDAFLGSLRTPRHRIDAERSRIVARLPLHGPLGSLAGAHVVRVVAAAGTLLWHPEAPEASAVELAFPVSALAVDEPADRRAAGLRRLPERLRRHWRRDLVGRLSQDGEHATVRFRGHGVERVAPGRYRLAGELELDGIRSAATVEAAVRATDVELWVEGVLRLRRTDLGLPSHRAAFGVLRVADEAEVTVSLVATACHPT